MDESQYIPGLSVHFGFRVREHSSESGWIRSPNGLAASLNHGQEVAGTNALGDLAANGILEDIIGFTLAEHIESTNVCMQLT